MRWRRHESKTWEKLFLVFLAHSPAHYFHQTSRFPITFVRWIVESFSVSKCELIYQYFWNLTQIITWWRSSECERMALKLIKYCAFLHANMNNNQWVDDEKIKFHIFLQFIYYTAVFFLKMKCEEGVVKKTLIFLSSNLFVLFR